MSRGAASATPPIKKTTKTGRGLSPASGPRRLPSGFPRQVIRLVPAHQLPCGSDPERIVEHGTQYPFNAIARRTPSDTLPTYAGAGDCSFSRCQPPTHPPNFEVDRASNKILGIEVDLPAVWGVDAR